MGKGIIDKLESYIDAQESVDGFCGTILVSQSGKRLFSKAKGLANREHLVPNHTDTKFRIGSVSKQFTAAAILLLQEQNKLSVVDRVDKFISDYPNGNEITIHHLLTHTSGVPNFTNFSEYNSIARKFSPLESTILHFKHLSLEFNPGERFFYSNSGYVILARIVELVTGECFSNYLDKSIFRPLGMYNTGSDNYDTVLLYRATGYKVWGDYVHADFIDMSIMMGAGGLYSTVEDMYMWDDALYSDKLLSEKSRNLMMTPHAAVNGITSYGYGLNISNEVILKNSLQTHKVIGLSGAINGFMTEYQRFTNEDLLIIVMSNVHPSQPANILKDVARIILGEDVPIPQSPKNIIVDHFHYEFFAGKYLSNNKKFNPTITVENAKLYIAYEPWYKYELRPIKTIQSCDTSLFRTVGAAGELEFFHDEVGRVVKGLFHLFSKTMNLTPNYY
jgi:CubicO group peptidase (beta-lactamase class C family)